MGLPGSQQRILAQIEADLRSADPRLAAVFAEFTRQTARSGMPGPQLPASWPGGGRREDAPAGRLTDDLDRATRPARRRWGRWPASGPAGRGVILALTVAVLLALLSLSALTLPLSQRCCGSEGAPMPPGASTATGAVPAAPGAGQMPLEFLPTRLAGRHAQIPGRLWPAHQRVAGMGLILTGAPGL